LNILSEGLKTLAQTHHAPILRAVLAALEKNHHPFAWHTSQRRLLLDVDAISQEVLAKHWREADVIALPPLERARTSTLPLLPQEQDEVRGLLHRIQGRLAQYLEAFAQQQRLSVEDLARQRMGTVQQEPPFGRLAPQMPDEIGRVFNARRKRLTFTKPSSAAQQTPSANASAAARSPLMRWHKLTLTIQVPERVMDHLAEAVGTALEQVVDAAEQEELRKRIKEQVVARQSDLARLVNLIATDTVGQLKKEACLSYLDMLEEQMDERNKARPLLRELLRRIRLLQAYLSRTDKADSDYEVSYRGQTMNLRTLFAQADALNDLPVFPLVDGMLGETTTNGRYSYVFGMKLKLNGRVARFGNLSSFGYHLALLRKRYQAPPDRLVRLAILYHVVFSQQGDSTYDPIAALEQDVLPVLQRDTTSPSGQEGIDRLFTTIATGCQQSHVAVNDLAAGLLQAVKRSTQATRSHRDVSLTLRTGILESSPTAIVDEGRLFRRVFDPHRKDYLAYLDVGEPRITGNALLTLRAEFTFEDILCFEAESQLENCAIEYDAAGWAMLPVLLLAPRNPLTSADLTPTLEAPAQPGLLIGCSSQIKRNGALEPAPTYSPTYWFLYRYVVTLLAYLGIRLLASFASDPAHLFISLARVHYVSVQADEEGTPESFLADLSKVLAHMLSVDYLANAQGLFQPAAPSSTVPGHRPPVAPLPNYKKENAASSLYTLLPKIFTLPQPLPEEVLPRLALVVVSSRDSDSLRQSNTGVSERLSTVYGEVVRMDRLDERRVRVSRRATFSGTYAAQELYTNPTIILDQMHHLYQAGYRHIFYIAQAPYSSTLHITRKESDRPGAEPEDDGLFFLSRQIIACCVQEKPGLHIYPVFRDQYHAMKLTGVLGADTLYIQDVAELVQVVEDRSQAQQLVVFLNLFSGHKHLASGDGVERYNGVVSYATLLNIYGGVLNERDLRAALIHDEGGKNPLKNLLVFFLTLFHLSRYEKQERGPIAIKLNPYEAIIGDQSVGASAWQPHANRSLRFNFLAFLTMVRNDILTQHEKRGES
jgi:hypothetical protein